MNSKELEIMAQGGHLLAQVRDTLAKSAKAGMTPVELDALADTLIDQTGGQAAFKKVPDYHHATCININTGVVHGIPTKIPFQIGDIVSIDVGLYYKGLYTDTAVTVCIGGHPTPAQKKFLDTGVLALQAGIKAAVPGAFVSNISKAVEAVIKAAGYSTIKELTGHGVGKQLHMDPYVPNYYDPHAPDSQLYTGQTLAIEPMYSTGSGKIAFAKDGWTITTADHSTAALFEHTIAITSRGPRILTI